MSKVKKSKKQTKPGKDYFDELAEVGQSKKHGLNLNAGDHHTSYDPVRTDESEGDLSEFSEVESQHSPGPVLKFVQHSPGERERKKGVTTFVEPQTDDDEDEGFKPLASRRKSATRPLPLKISNSNHAKSDPPSPAHSISSVTTLIRGKITTISNTLPRFFGKRRPEYKLQIFVAILFLTILVLVGSIYVIHQEKELQKAYFDKIRFSGKDRRIRVANLKGREVLTGVLGTGLTKRDKPWPCLEENRHEGESCLEWMNIARLYFRVASRRKDWDPSDHNMQCYGILWESLNPTFVPQDCFNVGENKGFHFYGAGEMGSNQWPLNRTIVPLTPYITGNGVSEPMDDFEWGRYLRRYFVGSPGVAIEISKDTPLHISINTDHPGMICFAAKRDSFAYPNYEPRNVLNYTLCTGDSPRDIQAQLADKDIWDGVKFEDVHLTHALAESPIWRILPETINYGAESESSLLNHTDRIAELQLSEGFILLDETWQKHLGDLVMDPERFKTIEETFNLTRRRGFKVALTIQPFFSTESGNYVDGLKKDLWVKQKLPGSKQALHIPALMHYKSSLSSVLLDITKAEARVWLQEKIKHLVSEYGVDALFIELGSAQDLPQHYDFYEDLKSPDDYKDLFLQTVRNIKGVKTIGVTGAVKLPKLPTFVTLSPVESSWDGLRSIIPNILSMGIAGFPFIMPGPIGGDFKRTVFPTNSSSNATATDLGADSTNDTTLAPINVTKAISDFENNRPARDLYIRWLQLVHFLPVVQYTYLPSDYDDEVVKIATELKADRQTKLYPYIKKAITESLTTGLPIIRPLWMSDPTDANCLKSWDQFSIGGDIIVAPILYSNGTERDIYLPKGRWRDELDGSSNKGERWIHHYRIRYNQIAFFTKMAETV